MAKTKRRTKTAQSANKKLKSRINRIKLNGIKKIHLHLPRTNRRGLWFWIIPGVLIIGFLYFYIFKDFPSPGTLTSANLAQTTKIYDRNGELLYDIFVD